jgi:hypothetical protein
MCKQIKLLADFVLQKLLKWKGKLIPVRPLHLCRVVSSGHLLDCLILREMRFTLSSIEHLKFRVFDKSIHLKTQARFKKYIFTVSIKLRESFDETTLGDKFENKITVQPSQMGRHLLLIEQSDLYKHVSQATEKEYAWTD